MRPRPWFAAAALCLLAGISFAGFSPELPAEGAAPLAIETPTALPWATLFAPYSETLIATGGAPPYSWSIVSGSLPSGVALSAGGVLAGSPQSPGAFAFVVRVQDSAGSSVSKSLTLVVALPAAPTVNLTGLQDSVSPAEQLTFDVQLSSSYPLDITGTATLTFEPDAVNPCDDPAIQFSNGGRVLSFVVPAGQLNAVWNAPPALQTGTVAGKIRLRLAYSASGINLTPTIPPSRTLTISRSAPQIQSVQVIRGGAGFQIAVTGYATSRQVTQAKFEFTVLAGAETRATTVTVNVESAFNSWYRNEASAAFGSAFVYTQPFTVQGDVNAIRTVNVTLSNANGASSAVSASF